MLTRQSSSSTRALIQSDLSAVQTRNGRLAPYVFPNIFATASYRIAHRARQAGHPIVARGLTAVAQTLTGAEMDPSADIGPGLQLMHTAGVIVGPGVTAGANLTLFGHAVLGSTSGESRSDPRFGFPILGDNVLVLTKASVIGPVTVGDHVVIGAHALVLEDVPSQSVAKGVPATSAPL